MATANGERESLCLHILVKSAENLLKKDLFGMCDPYVRVILRRDNKIHSSVTKTKRKTRNPEWNEKFQFKDVNRTKDFLILEVYDEHRLTRDNFLGRVIIKLSEFEVEMKVEDIYTYGQPHTFQLKQRSHKSRVSGSLKLKLLYYNSSRLRGASRGGGPARAGGTARPTNGLADRQMSIASLVPGASGGLGASNGLQRPVNTALFHWSKLFIGTGPPPPSDDDTKIQRAWDSLVVDSSFQHLLCTASDDLTRARLLAVSVPESGAWLHALPISTLGLRMDDSTIRIAVGLRLGLPLSQPHTCHHCGADVDKFAIHPLSCKMSEGRHFRHSTVNSIIHRAFTTAAIPARLEPLGLSRADGKRPDGVTVVPWERGKCVVWDFTCPDTLARSYRAAAVSAPGTVAAQAENRKIAKYSRLDRSLYMFVPIAIETMGTFGERSLKFIKDLGKRIAFQTGDPLSRSYLFQRLSVAVQRGNAASILGTACLVA